MLMKIQHRVTIARRPRGLGYSTRLTISHATPTMIASVGRNGSWSSVAETMVSAPMGQGMPWNMPSFIVVQEKRASRSTTASTTTIAATTETCWWPSSATMPQMTTK